MRSIITDVAWSVSLSLCWSQLWAVAVLKRLTDRDVVSDMDSSGPKELVEGPNPFTGRAILGAHTKQRQEAVNIIMWSVSYARWCNYCTCCNYCLQCLHLSFVLILQECVLTCIFSMHFGQYAIVTVVTCSSLVHTGAHGSFCCHE